MISRDKRNYNYFTFGEPNAYGQPQLSKEPVGVIKIAIYISNQSIQDNINYKGATYIGFTNDLVDDSYVIDYNGIKLKVLYVNPKGRNKQVFMSEM